MKEEQEPCAVCGVLCFGGYCSQECEDIDTGKLRPVSIAEVLDGEP